MKKNQGKDVGQLFLTFELGQLVASAGLMHSGIPEEEWRMMLHRYTQQDWGEISKEDWKLNDLAVKNGDDRILAAYTARNGQKVYIETAWDRSYTTIYLAEEY